MQTFNTFETWEGEMDSVKQINSVFGMTYLEREDSCENKQKQTWSQQSIEEWFSNSVFKRIKDDYSFQ